MLLTLGGCPADADLDSLGLNVAADTLVKADVFELSGATSGSVDGPLSGVDDGPTVDSGIDPGTDLGSGVGFPDAYDDIRFAVEPTDGPRDLTVWCYAFTVNGDPLPHGIYEWSFDDEIEAGPMSTHAEIYRTFRAGGLHVVRLSLTVAGLTIPIGCAQGPDRTGDSAQVTVWPTISGVVYDVEGDPVAGVQVTVDGTDLATTTDAIGCYVLSVPYGSSGVLVPARPGYEFAPEAWSFSNLTSDLEGVDFRATDDDENNPPQADGQAVEMNEDVSATITLTGVDADDDPLTYIIAALPAHGGLWDDGDGHLIDAAELPYPLSSAGNHATYVPHGDYNGVDGFAFRVNDGSADSGPDPATVVLNVAAVNDAPSFTPPAHQSTNVGASLVVQMTAVSPGPADEAGQMVTFSAHSSDQAIIPDANLVFAGSELTVTALAVGGPVTITVAAQDDGGTENGGEDTSGGNFAVTVVTGPLISGTISRVPTVGASPPIGSIELVLDGSGASAGMDFSILTDVNGNYSIEVPDGWTGALAAADPDSVYLLPPTREYADPLRDPEAGQDFTAWLPPIGIPAPSFGIKETHYMYADATYDFGSGPQAYRDAGHGPYTHYVCNTQPNATDLSNPYGTTLVPRRTIPTSLAPGSVVEIHGGPYESPGEIIIYGEGTQQAPIFIRGVDNPRITQFLHVWHPTFAVTSAYMIIEELDLLKINILAPAHHVCLRHCDVHGNVDHGGIYVANYSPGLDIQQITLYNNMSHDNGDLEAQFDQDLRGVGIVGPRISYVWVLDNEFYRNSGDGFQVNAENDGDGSSLHHVYVGRNVAYSNRQSGFWSKQATDLIFSQNIAHDHRPCVSCGNTPGPGMGFQGGPENIWFLFNVIYDCEVGFFAGGAQGSTAEGHYFIGNRIYDIHASEEFDPENAYHLGQAFLMWHYGDKQIVSNTIYDVDGGISCPMDNVTVHIANTILSDVTEGSYHVDFPGNGTAAISDVYQDVLEGPIRIRWGGQTFASLAAFQAATDGGAGSVEGDPLFVAATDGDFHLLPDSPAADGGMATDAYATFESLYGLSIAVDADGRSRSVGNGCDIGAYELP